MSLKLSTRTEGELNGKRTYDMWQDIVVGKLHMQKNYECSIRLVYYQ